VNAVQIGYLAFNQGALIPSEKYAWGDRDSRLFRYTFNEGYYNNMPYGASYSTTQKSRKGLYNFIRPINNPAARLVELYVGEIYGGAIDLQELQGGAIPIETDNDALRPALITLYQDSNWQSQKNLYVRFGSMLGDVAVKLVDDRTTQRVYLEVLHPAKIHSVKRDSRGRVEQARIEYDKREINPTTGNSDVIYTYAEDITPDEFRTYRDGKPYAYFDNAEGQKTDNWRNEYGFVPLEIVQHHDMGLGWGASVFQHAIAKIDEINDAWSLLNDSVRKNVDIMWFMRMRRTDIDFPRSERDQVPLLFSSPDAQPPVAMVSNVDIASASQNVLNMMAELDRDMPELALHQLRSQGNMTAPGVRAGWSDAINKIVAARASYDNGLVNLNKMGLYMGAMNGYRGYEGVRGAKDLDDDRLEHHIAERAVIEDQLSELERLQTLQTLPANSELARLILEQLGIAEEKIDAIVGEMAEAAERETRAAVRGMAEAWFGAGPQEADDDDEQTEPAQAPGAFAQPAGTAAESNRPAA
jgi:hypothetical protein